MWVTAKRIGLSVPEMQLITLDDFTSFVEMWVGDDDAPRRATQDDINSMLG